MEAIAGEKAGILKHGVPAVFSRQRAEAAAVLRERAAQLAAPVTWVSDWTVSELELDARGCRYRLSGETEVEIHCPLAGAHQVENSSTAAVALTLLGLSARQIEEGIALARWPGRLERFGESPEIVLDGAHNPAGARALAAYIERFYAGRRITLIFGAMRDKAVDEIAGALFPVAERVIVTAPHQARALAAESLRDVSGHPNLQSSPDLRSALAEARRAAPDAIFITGSLFLVAEAREILEEGLSADA